MKPVKEKGEQAVGLKRELGLLSAVNIIIGVMIGSGIFVSPTAALKYSGSVGMCLVVWTVCGIISLLGALCFAELGTVVPRSGAEYAYLLETFGGLHKFWGPLPAFICSWVYVVVLRPAEIAVIVLTFAEYSIQPFHKLLGFESISHDDQQRIVKIISILGLAVITYINLVSVKVYMHVNNIFGFCKVFACLVVIGGGIYELAMGRTENLESGFEGTTSHPGHIALAFYNGLWAYDGWSSVTTVTEEIKNPEKNIPRSISIAVPIITGLYVFMNLAYMTVLSPTEMINSPAVAVSFGERVLGPFSFIIPLGVALSTFGCAMSIQFGVTRLCFVAGREGHFLEPMSCYIHVRRSTPAPAVALQGLIALLFILAGDIEALIEFASFLIWFFYGAAMVCLLTLRKTQPNLHRPYKVPLIIPIFTLAVALFLAVMPIATEPSPKFLCAIGFILSGVVFYIPFVYFKRRPRIMVADGHQNNTNIRISEQKCIEYNQFFTHAGIQKHIGKSIAKTHSPDSCMQDRSTYSILWQYARPKEFPHMAAISAIFPETGIVWACAGALISDEFVLTTASCLSYKNYTVRLGDLNLANENDNKEVKDFKANKIFIHPEFDFEKNLNNIGLLKLDQPVKFNAFIRPICLPKENISIVKSGIEVFWGRQHSSYTMPNKKRLQKIVVDYVSSENCHKTRSEIRNFIFNETLNYCFEIRKYGQNRHICGEGILQTKHESLYCMANIIGLTSFYLECLIPGTLNVYTRVDPYINWIEKIVWKS